MRSTLVLTIAIGEAYQRLAKITHPTLKAYAERLGADFRCIRQPKLATTTPHWEKFQVAHWLERYERVLYLDTDLLVRDDTPDLFALVPPTQLGAFNEAPFTFRSHELMIDTCKAYGVTLPDWDGRYINTGVMVLSQAHRALFAKPAEERFSFYEQTFLNVRLAQLGVALYELPYRFNRMHCVDRLVGQHRLASYIVHYAGAPNLASVMQLARDDRRAWARMQGDYHFPHHIHVSVSGGLGDQVCAEPALRFMRHHVYPDADIQVSTHHPLLFQHLDVVVHQHGEFAPAPDTPYYQVNSLPPPESVTWMVLSNLLAHTVDYCSAALLRRTLPMEDRRVHLRVAPEDVKTLAKRLPDVVLADLVVVHAGRHWQTKTFPVSWWQAVIDGVQAAGLQVCLIGKNDDLPADKRGVQPVTCPPGGLDLRNHLTLGELIALLQQAAVLVSNDSAPIHLAGAFENHIVLIPTCKHPEHVLPFRHGSVYWNAQALWTRLTLDDVSAQPTDIHGTSAEFEVADWSRYLPAPEAIVAAVKEGWDANR